MQREYGLNTSLHYEEPQEDDEGGAELLALRGGLKGRLAAECTVLQSSMDALLRCTRGCTDLAFAEAAQRMLQEMTTRIARIQRLADNAAELAVGATLRGMRERKPVELRGYLRSFCACAEEELFCCGRRVKLTLQAADEGKTLWVEGDYSLIDALLANLVSNSAAQGCKEIFIECTAARELLYRDDGTGLPQSCRQLLLEGRVDGQILERGSTGLLLVREYAAALGWKIAMEENDGSTLRFALPAFEIAAELAMAELKNSRIDEIIRARLCMNLHREFAATLVQAEQYD